MPLPQPLPLSCDLEGQMLCLSHQIIAGQEGGGGGGCSRAPGAGRAIVALLMPLAMLHYPNCLHGPGFDARLWCASWWRMAWYLYSRVQPPCSKNSLWLPQETKAPHHPTGLSTAQHALHRTHRARTEQPKMHN